MAHDDGVDFQPDEVELSDPSFEIEPPEASPTEAAITWRWATPSDLPALRVCHFQTEVEAGKELFLPDGPSGQRVIAVAEKNGRIVGGLFAEDSVIVTMVGLEQSVAKSAYDAVIQPLLTFARDEGTRVVEIRLPRGVHFDLETGAEAGPEKPTQ
jgi:hypothetical protein